MPGGCPAPDGTDLRRPIRQRVLATLKAKGFEEARIRTNEPFVLTTNEEEIRIPIDLLVCLNETPVLLVKCVNGHLSTRERASVSMARLFSDHPIPFAVVANQLDAVVVDALTGKTVGFGYKEIPGPDDAARKIHACASVSLSESQREREERILATYYHIRCDPPNEPF